MRKIAIGLVCSIFIFLTSACGQLNDRDGSLNSVIGNDGADKPEPVTLALIGGFRSCKKGVTLNNMMMMNWLENLHGDVSGLEGLEIKVIRLCQYLSWGANFAKYGVGMNIKKERNVSVTKFIENFRSLAKGRVYLVGHSYGGWITLKIADTFDNSDRLRGVYTLDPISMKECHHGTSTAAAVLSPVTANQATVGCRRAPADLQDIYPRIRVRAKRFVNFYQDEAYPVHSGPIRWAHENHHLSYAGNSKYKGKMGGSHSYIVEDRERVHKVIAKEIMQDVFADGDE